MSRTAELRVRRPNELELELPTARRLDERVQPAGRVDLCHGLIVDGLGERAWKRLEEALQRERDRGWSRRRLVLWWCKQPPLCRSRLPVSELDEVQYTLGDRIRGARGFSLFERSIFDVDRECAEQM